MNPQARTVSTRSSSSAPSPSAEVAALGLELGRVRIERDQARAQVVELTGRIERLERLIPEPPPRGSEGSDAEAAPNPDELGDELEEPTP